MWPWPWPPPPSPLSTPANPNLFSGRFREPRPHAPGAQAATSFAMKDHASYFFPNSSELILIALLKVEGVGGGFRSLVNG